MSDLNKRCKSDPKAKCQYGDEIERLRLLQEDTALKCLHQEEEIERLQKAKKRLINEHRKSVMREKELLTAAAANARAADNNAVEIERLRALASEQAEQTVKLNRVVYRMGAALERIAAIPVHHVGWHEIAREALESGDE